ncbi:type IV secretion system DNA-binding domain-containing protein [Candidatus Woesearchaeota archaeon]|nr:type IV secretion system DNA-binding domain-containing protein [Candidatus Woesearchaeota archaeon]
MIELNNKDSVTHFAVTNYRNIRKRFGIKKKDRSGHMYIIGKTGVGKSTLIENMVTSDIKEGHGVALIDPHGDLADNILDFVPESRIQDVIYFNPADIEYPIAFNPLEDIHLDYHHLVSSSLISVLKKVWPEFWGPRLEHILRNSIMALLENPTSTLLDMPKLLTDKEYRMIVVASITNQQVREFWLFEFEKYSARFRSEAISPILNKIGQFLTSIPLRNIVGQKENTFDLRKIMDEGKILIVNLSKGKIGEDNSSLLGAMMIAKIQQAAMSRANIPEEKRKPFYLYVDEFHNFLTLSFADILSESRKYGLSLVLAHQYIEQLDEKIRAAVFGNVGTLISFRVGAEDAKYLSREFYPVFDQTDLVNLSNHHIYLKLMIDGVTSKPFSATSLPPRGSVVSYKDEIIRSTREKYTKTRKEVESEMETIFEGDEKGKDESVQGRLFL